MREPIVFEFWPLDKVKNPHGEVGIVVNSAIEPSDQQKFWVDFPGEKKGQWYSAEQLTLIED